MLMLLPIALTGPAVVGLPAPITAHAWAAESPEAQETATPLPPAATAAAPDAEPSATPHDKPVAEPSETASPEAQDRANAEDGAAAPERRPPAAPADGITDLTGTGSWVAVGQRWQWRSKDGSLARSCWARINGAVYRFDDDGNMLTGWWKDGQSWYHLAASGARSTGWVQDTGTWYYLDPTTGIMATGELIDGSATYFMRSNGAMVTGWLQQADGWRFYHPSGVRAHGWVQDAGTWYYLNPTTGIMATGWLSTGGHWFYLQSSGAMATGWLQVGGSWYYLNPTSGAMATDWLKDGATWYYLDPGSGAMVTGTRTINGTSQSFAPSGAWIGYQAPSGYLQPVASITPLGWSTNALTWGMNGVKVRIVQQRLGLWHSTKLASVDASFVSAVRNFQRRAGLPQTGVVDESTWNALNTGFSWWVDQHQEPPTSLSATRGERIEAMIGYAWNQIGSSYTWGGAGPYGLGFDCSGLVLQSLYRAGLDPQPINVIKHGWPDYRTSQELYRHPQMMHVPLSQRQRGDLIFYTSNGVVTHVAIYLGGDQVIHTDWMGRPARVDHITVSYGWGNMTSDVVRPFP
ncbi:NlpC/P60 family protein [Actinomyces sp. ZJ308]|uniref:NlpC/P60 family protein n=1 Tax=Actinomyces sp. ZJ308 TaxID=2708342 RepID=UPI001FB97BC2|nr:NlpC/P60 family protein [Actinomyces sp. ZJ308]